MALDPSISLGVKNFAPPPMSFSDYAQNTMKLAQMGQAISASKAEQANTEAQLPGIVADAAGKVREQAYNTFLKDNKDAFMDVLPDGSTAFNPAKAANVISAAGFADKAREGLGKDLMNQSQVIQNAQGNIKTQADTIDLGNKVTKAKLDATGYISNALLHTPEEQRPAMLQQWASGLDKAFPPELGVGAEVIGRLGTVTPVTELDPATGKQVPVIDPSTGKPKTTITVNPDAVKAHYQATVDAATQQNIAQRQTELNSNLDRLGQSPEAYQPGSSISVGARQALAKQGITVDPSKNYHDLVIEFGKEKLQSLASNDVVSQEYRLGIKEKAAAAQTDISNINTIQKAANAYGPAILGTKPGSIGSALFEKTIKQNPQLAGLMTAVQLYNTRFPDDKIDPGALSVREILAKMDQWKAVRQNDLATNLSNMGPNINTGTGEGAPNTPQVAPQAGTPSSGAGIVPPQPQGAPRQLTRTDGKVLMTSPSGKTGYVAANEVQQALAAKWTLAK